MSDSIIDRIERYGYPHEERFHVCPRCGDECRRFFVQDGEVLGCENCIDEIDADDQED